VGELVANPARRAATAMTKRPVAGPVSIRPEPPDGSFGENLTTVGIGTIKVKPT
jgi:hypothetical protein